MQVQPPAEPLLETARALLRDELLPHLPHERRHAALMIGQAMAIAARALRRDDRRGTADADDVAELAALAHLLDWPTGDLPEGRDATRSRLTEANRQLCSRLRKGEADHGAWRAQVLQHLHAVNRDRLEVSNPQALGPAE